MKCPVCNNELQEFNAGAITVDICCDGCSGIWFDSDEFEKCDQDTEPFPAELLRMQKSPNVVIDRSKARHCPKCSETGSSPTLSRVVVNPETRFELDSCPQCSGVWLDVGELEHIRNLDADNSARKEKLVAYEESVLKSVADAKVKFGVKALLKKLL